MLFKILQGPSSRIDTETTPLHEGYCYFTPDDSGFYIDAKVDGVLQRILINPKDYIIEKNDGMKLKFWCGTKEEYDAIKTKDNTVFYIVTGEGSSGGTIDVSEQIEKHNTDTEAHSDIRAMIDENLADMQSALSDLNVIKEINANQEQKFWRGTKAEYDALTTKDDTVLYIVTDDDGGAVSGNSDIFVAVYGETSAADIYAAQQDGKAVFCVNGGVVAALISCTSTTAYFSQIDSTTDGDTISCNVLYVTNDTWSSRMTEMQKKIFADGILKTNENGDVVAAEAGVDYVSPTDIESVYLTDVVTYTAETKTDAEKAVARNNIGAEVSGAAAEALNTAKEYTDTKLSNFSSVSVYEATIGTTWTEDSTTGVKTQTVSIAGVTAANTAKVDVCYTGNGTSDSYSTFVEQQNQFLERITNGFAETVDGGIKFTIFGSASTVSIPIVVEVS